MRVVWRSRWTTTAASAVALAFLVGDAARAGTAIVKAPLTCSRGPSEQWFHAEITLPETAQEGSAYSVRIDGEPSRRIAHFGLNYIHDMATDYALPAGTTYVTGSARIVPRTGTANATPGARVWHEAGTIHVLLPAQIEAGSSYTPPSIEFGLTVAAKPGTSLALQLVQYRVTANAFLVGDVKTTCDPTPKPYPLGATVVVAAPLP